MKSERRTGIVRTLGEMPPHLPAVRSAFGTARLVTGHVALAAAGVLDAHDDVLVLAVRDRTASFAALFAVGVGSLVVLGHEEAKAQQGKDQSGHACSVFRSEGGARGSGPSLHPVKDGRRGPGEETHSVRP